MYQTFLTCSAFQGSSPIQLSDCYTHFLVADMVMKPLQVTCSASLWYIGTQSTWRISSDFFHFTITLYLRTPLVYFNCIKRTVTDAVLYFSSTIESIVGGILTLLYFSRTLLPHDRRRVDILSDVSPWPSCLRLSSGFPSHCTISVHQLPSGFVAFPAVVVLPSIRESW